MVKDAKDLRIRTVRAYRKLSRSQLPPKKKPGRPPRKNRRITKIRFLSALKGTGGVMLDVAARLGCAYGSVYELLRRHKDDILWGDVRQAIEDERNKVADLAEQTIHYAVIQRLDVGLAALNARWLLTRARHRDRQMGDESKVIHEGGDKPVQIQTDDISIEALDLPVEVRRQILEAIDRKKEDEKPD